MSLANVNVISNLPWEALMEEDCHTPCVRKLKSRLGKSFFYQRFINGSSAIPNPMFGLKQVRRGMDRLVRQGEGLASSEC